MDVGMWNAMILAIKEGVANKLARDNFTVYKVGYKAEKNLIQINILIGKDKQEREDKHD